MLCPMRKGPKHIDLERTRKRKRDLRESVKTTIGVIFAILTFVWGIIEHFL